MKRRTGVAGLLALWLLGCGGAGELPETEDLPGEEPVLIGFSMGGIRMERWQKDERIVIERAREQGAMVICLTASENPELQNEQAENLIIQGVDVLLVVPQDAELSARIVHMAHEAGIQVIAYDRIIRNSPLDYYISFDSVQVGVYQAQGVLDALDLSRTNRLVYLGGSPVDDNSYQLKQGAMSVLEPWIEQGKVILDLEAFTRDWSAQNAYLTMKAYLDEGGRPAGVVAANDALASGAIQALDEVGLAGRIPVSGQDAELTACQRVAQGLQTVTVYKPLRELGHRAVDMAIRVARGLPVEVNAAVDNQYREVPSLLLETIPVTRENLETTVIADGFHSHEDVFGSDVPMPRGN